MRKRQDFNAHFTKEPISKWVFSIWKGAQFHYSSGKCKFKPEWNCITIRMSKMRKRENTQCWQRSRTKGILTHYWWKYRFVQLLWRTIWQYLLKLNNALWPSNSTPIYVPNRNAYIGSPKHLYKKCS